MFQLQRENRYSWPVKVVLPSPSGAVQEEYCFEGQFQLLDADQLKRLENQPNPMFAHEVLVGFSEVMNKEQSLPYSVANKQKLLSSIFVAKAVVKAYFELLDKGDRKN